jgi:hypothetical protein
MVRFSLMLAVAAGVAFSAAAQAPAPSTTHAPNGDRYTQLFISPMGEPFRGTANDDYPSDAWFKGADKDGDGVMTRAEFRDDALRFFQALDADGDGVLDGEEIKHYEDRVAPEITADILLTDAAREARARPDEAMERGPQGEAPTVRADDSRIDKNLAASQSAQRDLMNSRRGAGKFGILDDPDPVHGCDTNIDFRVSLKEWMAAADRRFDRIDLKHKGRIERADLPVTPFQQLLRLKKK